MAETHGSHTRIYANGLNISAQFREAEFGRNRDLLDITAFSDSADAQFPSPVVAGDLSASGMLDAAAGSAPIREMLDDAANALTGDSVVVAMLTDTAVGDPGFALIGSVNENRVVAPLKDVVQTNFKAQSNRAVWVKSLHPLAARTAAHDGTSLDNSASSAYGGVGTAVVTALSGTNPVLALKIQHSTDDNTWVDLITFDAINTAGVTAGYKDHAIVTGTVNRYLRTKLTVSSGSLTSVTFAAQFGRYTANY